MTHPTQQPEFVDQPVEVVWVTTLHQAERNLATKEARETWQCAVDSGNRTALWDGDTEGSSRCN